MRTFNWSMVAAEPAPVILVVSSYVQAAHALAKTYAAFTGGYVCNPMRIAATRVKYPTGLPQLIGVRHLPCGPKDCPNDLRHLILNNDKYDAALFLHVYPDDAHRVPSEYRQHCSFITVDRPQTLCTTHFKWVWGFTPPRVPFPIIVYNGAGSGCEPWTGRLTDRLEGAMIGRMKKRCVQHWRHRPTRRAKIHARPFMIPSRSTSLTARR